MCIPIVEISTECDVSIMKISFPIVEISMEFDVSIMECDVSIMEISLDCIFPLWK